MRLEQASIDRLVGDLSRAKLGDPRRTKRACKVVAKLARRPSVALPAVLASEAEIEGAYRLMNNARVTFEALVEAHAEGTQERARKAGRVLVVHDTTDCAFPELDGDEVGYLQTGKAGFRLHVSLVLDAGHWRRPLGIISAETIHRPKRTKAEKSKRQKASGPETAKWADREYTRWSRGVAAAAKRLKGCKSVHVGDREADSFDFMAELVAGKQSFIFRVRVPERRSRSAAETGQSWSTVRVVANAATGVICRNVPLAKRLAKTAPQARRTHPAREEREAKLEFAATKIEIPRPQYLKAPVPATLALNLIRVFEPNPPAGEEPVEWLLYTTEPIDSPEDIERIVDDYRTRWTIEEFNAALKGGCAFEARQFESRAALLNMLALSLPVACELLWLRSRARSLPDAPASEVMSPLQLRILRELGPRTLPDDATAAQALFALAGLGGHIKSNGPPGWKILQRAMMELLTYERAWRAATTSRHTSRRDM
jgi:hypothetical protein